MRERTWAESTTSRVQPGGDLYRAPLSREQMLAPLTWAERQLAVVWRYGELANGEIGWERRV